MSAPFTHSSHLPRHAAQGSYRVKLEIAAKLQPGDLITSHNQVFYKQDGTRFSDAECTVKLCADAPYIFILSSMPSLTVKSVILSNGTDQEPVELLADTTEVATAPNALALMVSTAADSLTTSAPSTATTSGVQPLSPQVTGPPPHDALTDLMGLDEPKPAAAPLASPEASLPLQPSNPFQHLLTGDTTYAGVFQAQSSVQPLSPFPSVVACTSEVSQFSIQPTPEAASEMPPAGLREQPAVPSTGIPSLPSVHAPYVWRCDLSASLKGDRSKVQLFVQTEELGLLTLPVLVKVYPKPEKALRHGMRLRHIQYIAAAHPQLDAQANVVGTAFFEYMGL